MRVLDRGRGVATGEREAVFEPFYRSTITASAADGIGIGLSVCKRLIEALDGTIWCRERRGGGAEFSFALPLVTAEDEAVATPDVEVDTSIGAGPLVEPTA